MSVEENFMRQKEGGPIYYPATWDRLPTVLKGPYGDILEATQNIHRYLKNEVLIPAGVSIDEFYQAVAHNPLLGRSDTVVRTVENGRRKLIPFFLLNFPEYAQPFGRIRDAYRRVALAGKRRLQDDRLTREAEIFRQGFETGETEEAVEEYIDRKKHAKWGSFTGPLDRIPSYPNKNYFQSFVYIQHPRVSELYTAWSRDVLRGMGRVGRDETVPYVDFIEGDAAGQAGRPADDDIQGWQANALPSQIYIADKVGGVVLSFRNVREYKWDKEIRPIAAVVMPESVYSHWEDMGPERQVIIGAHEISHPAQEVKEDDPRRLGDMYQPLREAYSINGELYIPIYYPKVGIVDNNYETVEGLFHLESARNFSHIEKYKARVKKQGELITPAHALYAYGAAYWLNRGESLGYLFRTHKGSFRYKSKESLAAGVEMLRAELQYWTSEASRSEVEDNLYKYSEWPNPLLRETPLAIKAA